MELQEKFIIRTGLTSKEDEFILYLVNRLMYERFGFKSCERDLKAMSFDIIDKYCSKDYDDGFVNVSVGTTFMANRDAFRQIYCDVRRVFRDVNSEICIYSRYDDIDDDAFGVSDVIKDIKLAKTCFEQNSPFSIDERIMIDTEELDYENDLYCTFSVSMFDDVINKLSNIDGSKTIYCDPISRSVREKLIERMAECVKTIESARYDLLETNEEDADKLGDEAAKLRATEADLSYCYDKLKESGMTFFQNSIKSYMMIFLS
jgi:hypothetical protein